MAIFGVICDYDEEMYISPADFEDGFVTERIQQKHARAQRRKDNRRAKNRLRCLAVDDAENFFSMSKEEQRRAVHQSPYSYGRLTGNHMDMVFGALAKAEKLEKAERDEMVLLRKEYLGSLTHQDNELLVPTHIEMLVEELAEICGGTTDFFNEDHELLVFYTKIYRPDMFRDVCEYVYGA